MHQTSIVSSDPCSRDLTSSQRALRLWDSLDRTATLAHDVLQFPRRVVRVFTDLTFGTLIVLVHVAIAERTTLRGYPLAPRNMTDGTRSWDSQISP